MTMDFKGRRSSFMLIGLALPLLTTSWQLPSAITQTSHVSNRSRKPLPTAAAALRGRPSAAAAVDHSDGSAPFGSSRLLHAMLRVADRDAAVAFWEGRGARIISPGGPGATFVGFGAYRDTEHFALELAQVSPESATKLVNSVVSYIGLSMLLPQQPPGAEDTEADIPDDPLARFLAARSAKPWSMQDASGAVDALRGADGLEVKSVASAPGDPFAQFSLRTASVETLAASATFYTGVLGMSEVGAPSETQRCFRYAALPGGALEGVPTTLVFRVEDGFAGDSVSTEECFDHIAISCVDVDAASAHITGGEAGETPLAPVILEPCGMFGTRIMGVRDPNGYKVYLVEEAGFRSG